MQVYLMKFLKLHRWSAVQCRSTMSRRHNIKPIVHGIEEPCSRHSISHHLTRLHKEYPSRTEAVTEELLKKSANQTNFMGFYIDNKFGLSTC